MKKCKTSLTNIFLALRIVFFQTKFSTCIKRKAKEYEKKIKTTQAKDQKLEKVELKIKLFDLMAPKMIEECKGLKEVEFIDANRSFETVRKNLWAMIEKVKNM